MTGEHPSQQDNDGFVDAAQQRTARDLATHQGNETSHSIWPLVQRGLVYPAPHVIFATFWCREDPHAAPLSRAQLRQLMHELRGDIHQHFGSAHTTVTVGVGFALWQRWCDEAGDAYPAGMTFRFPLTSSGDQAQSAIFQRTTSTFANTQGDLWFHIKSDDPTHCDGVFSLLSQRLAVTGNIAMDRIVVQPAATKSNRPDHQGGKVLGCRFSENLNNPTDPVNIQSHVLVGFEDVQHMGASFVLTQRFFINWEHLLNMGPQQIEDLVGRTTDDTLIPSNDSRSHIKSSRVQDAQGNTMQVLRLSLPFGRSAAIENSDLREKGANLRDEEGFYVAVLARSAQILESIMDQQIGTHPHFMHDRLLAMMHADSGGFFYIPSLADLGLAPVTIASLDQMDWSCFPGVDWNRLDRHFQRRSSNGLMYYNHKDYLFHMGTMTGAERQLVSPPSHRVLRLLATMFSRWQDNWYMPRDQQELPHLRTWLVEHLDTAMVEEVMNLSIVERMGWAIKASLGDVFVNSTYGFRGRRCDANGNWINGADTYRIHPLELIVGALPNLSLGQGRYVMDYTRDEEHLDHFFRGLSPSSGVGHVIPNYQWLLDQGLEAIKRHVTDLLAGVETLAKQQFYRGILLSLEGVQEHCLAYARLAREVAATLAPTEAAERDNLYAIHARMQRLATEPPATMLEATQLLFTFHACLHLIGEPTAIGRLDQLLLPFYEADLQAGRLDEDQAQEIIDCLWVKLGEKVQLNRMFVEDHQPYGNLAMGGMSGPYPQGAANNQWIQQVTVGGTIADDAPGAGTPAYNSLTLYCLRAARRLPLNAPCLSLRVRPDMPALYGAEAARAILSGGAHPILLQDDKIIPGLAASGTTVGQGYVQETAGDRWNSTVSLKDARNYACDGCYEPQFVGQNWFTLGGLTTLLPLEAALNQGKSWAMAGPMYFRGQRISFSSPPAKDIVSFEDLLELFYKHLHWMYAKQVDGLLGIFGTMSDVCPSPLLSPFIEGCLEKGLDIYAGGARYNVVAPCFTALANTINALYAIRCMVFDPTTAVTSLPELVDALICDWGFKMEEPFISSLAGPARIEARAERYRALRATACTLPKYGRGHAAIDAFGNTVIQRIVTIAVGVFTDPAPSIAQKMVALADRYGTAEHPFGGFQIQPGVGTFENYVEFGATCGASADGRRLGEPLASDLSPAPSLADMPIEHQETRFLHALAGYTGEGTEGLCDGAPTDFNIREDFPAEALERVISAFSQGSGSNILTITCANPDTFAAATRDPEQYDLLRVRMGGWSEFFVAMFPQHQAQHQRRPLSTPDTDS